MPATEYLSWRAFYNKRPFGEVRADMRNAMFMALTANLNRKKGKPPVKAEKFMPDFGNKKRKRREMSMPEMETALKAQFLAMGGNPQDLN